MAVDLAHVPKGQRAALRRLTRQPVPSKYGNRRSESRDGHTFASQRERNRYEELVILQAADEIRALALQVRFPFVVSQVPIGVYVADFVYYERASGWKRIVEDVKGHRTQVYLLKRKLMKALHDVEIRET